MKNLKTASFLPRLAALAAISMLACFAAVPTSNATLLTYFNFEDSVTDVPNLVSDTAAPAPLFPSAITTTFVGTANTGIGTSTGTTLNAAPGNTQAANLALRLGGGTGAAMDGTGGNNGAFIQFATSMTGFENLVLTYATLRSASGFTTQTLTYSIDGVNFLAGGVFSTTPSGTGTLGLTFSVATFDLSAITALDNAASVIVRLTFTGATGSTGQNSLDNIQVNADPIPEPATVIGGLIGVAGLFFHQRRRFLALVRPA